MGTCVIRCLSEKHLFLLWTIFPINHFMCMDTVMIHQSFKLGLVVWTPTFSCSCSSWSSWIFLDCISHFYHGLFYSPCEVLWTSQFWTAHCWEADVGGSSGDGLSMSTRSSGLHRSWHSQVTAWLMPTAPDNCQFPPPPIRPPQKNHTHNLVIWYSSWVQEPR